MGSMTKVMQKIGEDSSTAEPAPPNAEASPSSADTPSEESAPEVVSAFVVDDASSPPAPADAEVSPPDAEQHSVDAGTQDAETVAWDPRRVDPVVVAFHDRYSAICEQYRSVRARLLTMNSTGTPQVIAVTSAIPEEGKTVSTLNLSLVMAEGGEHRILLADADFRRTSIARMLGISEQPGLAEVLRGEVSLEEAVQPTPFPNLRVLAAGKVRDNAYGELLGGPRIDPVLDAFRNAFDYALLDTPPITTVSDVCLLAPRCNGAIVVVQMRRTPEPTVQQAVRTLQANNVKIMGTILSRFRDRGSGYYEHYHSYYYHYYR